jgi:hypothetical protein
MLACRYFLLSFGVIAIGINLTGRVDYILAGKFVIDAATNYHYFAFTLADLSFFFFAFNHLLYEG